MTETGRGFCTNDIAGQGILGLKRIRTANAKRRFERLVYIYVIEKFLSSGMYRTWDYYFQSLRSSLPS